MDMMNLRYKQLLKAYQALENMLNETQQLSIDTSQIQKEAFRDATIKRFEFCYELTWKYLKMFLEARFGIIQRSPKATVQECFKQKVINQMETQLLQKMIDDRNATSHIYDEERASQICKRIPDYYVMLNEISQRINP